MNDLQSEIEVLQSIYGDEIEVAYPNETNSNVLIKIKVKPNEESGILSFVKLTFEIPADYPTVTPVVIVSNPRGISEENCFILQKHVNDFLKEHSGENVIFDILQLCNDFLFTIKDEDLSICHICFDHLSSSTVYATPCDHYFHETCFRIYITHRKKDLLVELEKLPYGMKQNLKLNLLCPVCREIVEENLCLELTHDATELPVSSSSQSFDFDWNKWKSEKCQMDMIYRKQKMNGGIIDEDEERQKYLIQIQPETEQPSGSSNELQNQVESSCSDLAKQENHNVSSKKETANKRRGCRHNEQYRKK